MINAFGTITILVRFYRVIGQLWPLLPLIDLHRIIELGTNTPQRYPRGDATRDAWPPPTEKFEITTQTPDKIQSFKTGATVRL